ncbi:hypothetical protein SLEP1_g1870 [Rubroshorea leprosula]|uniref:Uncharacterized protein n=1 Tax=Rubroshorea leprosula TaxID=152421 RepID=A0AAV5HLV0_9ROSI|nr:hypothetical protein SLEP1_g1870 [Rubroshorea leprosula]
MQPNYGLLSLHLKLLDSGFKSIIPVRDSLNCAFNSATTYRLAG